MKNIVFVAVLMLMTLCATAQESIFTLSGGYAFANIEDSDDKGTGFRINGLYEFNPYAGIVAHGIAFGYINVKSEDVVLQQTITSTVNSFPIYYAPKVMLGNEKIKGFLKGAIGTQISALKREGLTTLTDSDFGFYGGGGAGIMFFLKENIFLSAEYEICWASNSWYKDGWMNSAMAGIGFRF